MAALDPYLPLPIHWYADMEYMISVLKAFSHLMCLRCGFNALRGECKFDADSMCIGPFHTSRLQSTYYVIDTPTTLSARQLESSFFAMAAGLFLYIALFLWLRYVHLCHKHRLEREIRATAANERARARRRRVL